jgi:hypothetical protein
MGIGTKKRPVALPIQYYRLQNFANENPTMTCGVIVGHKNYFFVGQDGMDTTLLTKA